MTVDHWALSNRVFALLYLVALIALFVLPDPWSFLIGYVALLLCAWQTVAVYRVKRKACR